MTTMTREKILKAVSERKSFWGVGCSKADLSGADLRGANLSGAILSGTDLRGADLRGANLSKANLSGANLSGANLSGANLSEANLSGADLYGANLSKANLSGANLYGANLSKANLSGAYLSKADLYGADLRGADLRGADLRGANLSGAITDSKTKFPDFQLCPQTGTFEAWKKVRGNVILKLEIRGKRTSSLVGRKCRTASAKVLAAFGKNAGKSKEFKSMHDEKFIYRVGKIVKAEYDPDIKVECTKGIHFFMTREEAEGYGY